MRPTCAENVFDAATPTSSPVRVNSTESTSRVICEPIWFVIATVRAPSCRASCMAWIVSRVSPDCEIADHERVLVDHRAAVDPLAGDVRLDRDAAPFLDHVPADDAGVVRGPAGDDDDPAQLAQVVLVHAEAVAHEPAVAHAVADRLGEAVGLLVDLLEHVRLVARALGDLVVPVDLVHLELDRPAVGGADVAHAVRRELDDLAVGRVLDAPRLGEEGGDVGGDEALAVARARPRAASAGARRRAARARRGG